MVDVKEITKKLKELKSLKQKLDYLESLLKNTKRDEEIIKLHEIIKNLLEQQESLENKITEKVIPPKRVAEAIRAITNEEPSRKFRIVHQDLKEKPKTSQEIYEIEPERLKYTTNEQRINTTEFEQVQRSRDNRENIAFETRGTQYTPKEDPKNYINIRTQERSTHHNPQIDPLKIFDEEKKDEKRVYMKKEK